MKRENVCFICGFATHEICNFALLDEIDGIYSFQKFEFSFYMHLSIYFALCVANNV